MFSDNLWLSIKKTVVSQTYPQLLLGWQIPFGLMLYGLYYAIFYIRFHRQEDGVHVSVTVISDDFKKLVDPSFDSVPIDLSDFTAHSCMAFLSEMLKIRLVEKKLAEAKRDGLIGGPVHLGVGQEAVAVGVSAHLIKTDRVFGAHRSHSHVLALGSKIEKLFSEILGKDTGLSRGMGGSMHLWDQPNGFFGSVPIVAGTIPLAVGAGMAARLQGTQDIAVAYFGDGACEEGVFHESLNLASIQKDPVLFVVENNFFASHMHWSQRQPEVSVSRYAVAHGVECRVVDGNDVASVANAASALISRARHGGGPGLLEAFTYRWYGHVDWREDVDVGVSRSAEDVENWKKKDPIQRLLSGLVANGACSISEYNELLAEITRSVDTCWKIAVDAPYPREQELSKRVYS